MKTINLNISAGDSSAIQQLGKLGVLRVENWLDVGSRMEISLHERTWGEWLGEVFDPGKAAQAREAAAEALERAVNVAGAHRQLAQNIRDRVNQKADITGAELARELVSIASGHSPVPVRGGAIAADDKGKRIDFISAPPEKIRCDLAVLSAATALAELSARKDKHHEWLNLHARLGDQQALEVDDPDSQGRSGVADSFPVGLAAEDWTCLRDVELPPVGGGEAQLRPVDVKALVLKALQGKSGSVVIEPFPDMLTERHGTQSRSHSDEGLQAQLETARDAVNAAAGNLVISFACKDGAVLQKLQAIHHAMEARAPGNVTETSIEPAEAIQLSRQRLAAMDVQEKVTWQATTDHGLAQKMSGDSLEGGATVETNSEGFSQIKGWMALEMMTPTGDEAEYRELKNAQMAWAYRQVLSKASTTVAIAPIEDIPTDEQIIREQVAENQWMQRGIISCSDDSIRLLFEAILEARKEKPELKVIVACNEYADEDTLALRVAGCMDELGLSHPWD